MTFSYLFQVFFYFHFYLIYHLQSLCQPFGWKSTDSVNLISWITNYIVVRNCMNRLKFSSGWRLGSRNLFQPFGAGTISTAVFAAVGSWITARDSGWFWRGTQKSSEKRSGGRSRNSSLPCRWFVIFYI